MTNEPDELLPAPDSPAQVARRRALVRERQAWIAGAIAAAVVVVLLVVVAATSGGGSPRANHSAQTRSTSSRPSRTTTSTSGDETSKSSTTTGSGSGGITGGTSGGTTAGGSTVTTAPAPAGADVSQDITISENSGACSWQSDTQELVDTGKVVNRGNVEAEVDFEVTWSDSSGELDTWDDLETVPAHGSIPWEGSSGWTDPVQGVTCQINLLSATGSGT